MTAAVGARNRVKNDAGVVYALMQARYQNSNRGQFISEDPVFLGDPKQQVLTDPQSLNSYSYANDNPITKSDPNGKWFIEFGASYDDFGLGAGLAKLGVRANFQGVNMYWNGGLSRGTADTIPFSLTFHTGQLTHKSSNSDTVGGQGGIPIRPAC